MEQALSTAITPATPTAVAQWLKQLGKDYLALRDRVISAEEQSWRRSADVIPSITGSYKRADSDSGARTGARSRAPTLLRGKMKLWFGAGAAAFVAVLGLIVWLARSPDIETPKPKAPDPVTVPTVPPTTPAPAAVAAPVTTPATATTTTATAPAAAVTTAPTTPPEPVRTRPVRPVERPTPRIVRSVPRPTPPVTKTESVTPVAVQPAAGSAAATPDNCNPPYYFEGKKKIFKTACL